MLWWMVACSEPTDPTDGSPDPTDPPAGTDTGTAPPTDTDPPTEPPEPTGDTGAVTTDTGTPPLGPCDAVPPPLAPARVFGLTRPARAFDFDDRGYVHYGDDFGALRVSDGLAYDVEGPLVGYYQTARTVRVRARDTVLASGTLAETISVTYAFPFADEDHTTAPVTRWTLALDPRPGDDVIAIVNRSGDLALLQESTGAVTVVSPGVATTETAVAWNAAGDGLWVVTAAGLERYDFDAATDTLALDALALPLPSDTVTSLAVDQCENVYLLGVDATVSRFDPDTGSVVALGAFPTSWVRQLRWGNDAGPFRRDRLYAADFDAVYEVDVGFAGAPQPIDFP